jgi:hypothetical protein
MARTNRHMVLATALVSRFNSQIPIWFPPSAQNQNDLQVLRSSKGGKWERMRGFWSQVQQVYENRICTRVPSSLRIAWKGVGLHPGRPRKFLADIRDTRTQMRSSNTRII